MIEVVGIGADGLASCSPAGLAALRNAEVILGDRRQLDLVAQAVAAELIPWPRPLRDGIPGLIQQYAGRQTAALASGDPLVSGVGTTLVELLGPESVRLHPAVSSVALARAEMRWSAESTEVIRLRSPDSIRRVLTPGRRILILSADATSPGAVAEVCRLAGFPRSAITVLGDLGTAAQSRQDVTAETLAGSWPDLNVIALEVIGMRRAAGALAPGLPDNAFEHDGQITKRHVRAAALAALQPSPGELLWDLGAGAGSVGIEWARLHPRNRVVAVERDTTRVDRIRANAAALGVPGLDVRQATTADVLDDLPDPDAIFIGGGASAELMERCWVRLAANGRLVIHGVTVETQSLLADLHAQRGGELVQISVQTAAPLGRFRGWEPARPVWQLCLEKSVSGEKASGEENVPESMEEQ